MRLGKMEQTIMREFDSAPCNPATLAAIQRRVFELLRLGDEDEVKAKYDKEDGHLKIDVNVPMGSPVARKLKGAGWTVVKA